MIYGVNKYMKDVVAKDRGTAKKSISEELSSRRKILSISIEELSQKTSIPTKYLRRIDKGEWEGLPSAVYTRGFLRKYAQEIGYNPDEIVKKYDHRQEKIDLTRKNSFKKASQIRKIANISAKSARRAGVLIVLVIILGYIGYQLSAVLARPSLSVGQPSVEELLVEKDSIELSGIVERSADLYLNNRPLAVESDGTFRKKIELLPGLNLFEIKAVSRFGKERIIVKKVFYNP